MLTLNHSVQQDTFLNVIFFVNENVDTFSNEKTDKDIFIVEQENLCSTLEILKDHYGFLAEVISCISGIDLLEVGSSKYRFAIVYDLLSVKWNSRISLKIFVNELSIVESASFIHSSAGWYEREIWDLFGIYFNNHPDLRRILTDYGFEGHPLRKSFPLTGFVEAKYDIEKKQVVMTNISLTQEMRHFTYSQKFE